MNCELLDKLIGRLDDQKPRRLVLLAMCREMRAALADSHMDAARKHLADAVDAADEILAGRPQPPRVEDIENRRLLLDVEAELQARPRLARD